MHRRKSARITARLHARTRMRAAHTRDVRRRSRTYSSVPHFGPYSFFILLVTGLTVAMHGAQVEASQENGTSNELDGEEEEDKAGDRI